MKKDQQARKLGKRLALRRESLTQLDLQTLKSAAAAGACFTHYCRSGATCLCSSG
jgi:hypothetical protein